jgi:hypothetical protein
VLGAPTAARTGPNIESAFRFFDVRVVNAEKGCAILCTAYQEYEDAGKDTGKGQDCGNAELAGRGVRMSAAYCATVFFR